MCARTYTYKHIRLLETRSVTREKERVSKRERVTWCFTPRERDRERERERETETETERDRDRQRENSNANSKTLFYKNCSYGSVKNRSNNWSLLS